MVWFAEPTILSMAAGFVLVCCGESLRFWGVSIAGSETRTTGKVGGTYLITNGPFAYVRNPLYVGNMLMYIGIGVMSMALFPWLLSIAAAWPVDSEANMKSIRETWDDFSRGLSGTFLRCRRQKV
jgi:protein-S-isoprenylcysteine O-methyltransferase Ste14